MRARIVEDEEPTLRAREAARPRSRSTSPTPTSGASSSRGSPTCSGSTSRARARARRICSPPGGSSSSGSPSRLPDGARCSRTCSGRTRACSTSSSTCSSGRATSRSSSLTLARPGAARAAADLGRRPAQLHTRSTSSRSRPRRWSELLDGLVPGLPAELRDADPRPRRGRPALRGRDGADAARPGLLVQEGPRLPADRRRSSALEVPETLHALIAARLDGLSPDGAPPAPGRRRARKDVHEAGARGARRASEAELEPLLARSSRKEVLGVQADPRSPERGQYGFLQDLVRKVAYETLVEARSARRATSPPPQYLERACAADEQEVVEVIASHYLDAYEARPTPMTPPRSRRRPASALVARRRAGRVARRERGGAALLRAGGRARPTTRSSEADAARAGPARLARLAGDADGAGRSSSGRSRSTRPRARRIRPPGCRRGWPGRRPHGAARASTSTRLEDAFDVLVGRRARRGRSPCSRRAARAAYRFSRRPRPRRASGSELALEHRRGTAPAGGPRAGADTPRQCCSTSGGIDPTSRSDPAQARAPASRSSTTSRRRGRPRVQQPLRPAAFSRTATTMRSATADRGARSRAQGRRPRRRSGRSLAERTVSRSA